MASALAKVQKALIDLDDKSKIKHHQQLSLFMSTSTLDLENLTIGGEYMAQPSNRSLAQRDRRRRERLERETQSAVTDVRNVTSHSGIQYNLQSFSTSTRQLILEGLRSDTFSIDVARWVSATSDGDDDYFAFQIKKPWRVCIYAPGSKKAPTCTCENARGDKLCPHIYWLYDRINATLNDATRHDALIAGAEEYAPVVAGPSNQSDQSASTHRSSIGVSPTEVTKVFSRLYPAIGARIDLLPFILSQVSDPSASPPPDASPGDDLADNNIVKDMISLLHPTMLPEEFDGSFLEDLPRPQSSFADVVIAGEMVRTLFGLAHYDAEMARCLRRACTKDLCAIDVLHKTARRANEAFARFDAAAARSHHPGADRSFVFRAAILLRRLVASIPTYKESWRAPMPSTFYPQAAAIGLHILERVVERDGDVIPRPSAASVPASTRQPPRNLFAALLATPLPPPPPPLAHIDGDAGDDDADDDYDEDNAAASDPSGPEGVFVLETLFDHLPLLSWRDLVPRLADLDRRVREGNARPVAFLTKLETMIASRATRADFDVAEGASGNVQRGGSRRRAEEDSGREPRRRKVA